MSSEKPAALAALGGQFSSGAQPHDPEDGARSACAKKTAVLRVRYVSAKSTSQPQEQNAHVEDLDGRLAWPWPCDGPCMPPPRRAPHARKRRRRQPKRI